MKIGSSYRLREIQRRHWEACARDLRLPAQALIARAEAMIARMTEALPAVAHALHEEGIVDPIIGKLVEGIETHARACSERLGKCAPISIALRPVIMDAPGGGGSFGNTIAHRE